jgi:hypothetical protein
MSDSDLPATRDRVALAPDLRALSDRGTRAWVERMAVRPLDDCYAVDSESGETYVVDPVEGRCTCPDHEMRGETCKHLRRVAIEITAARVPPPGQRRTACAACGVETFAPTDADPPLCETCALDPGDVVLDRETGDRLVVAAVTPDRADETQIAAAETTVAEYSTNEGYPDDDIVVEATYATDLIRRENPRRYSFPRSRLERTDDAAFVE